MQTRWIDEAEQLHDWCRNLDGGPVAVDTESDHFHAYQAQICLIQLATRRNSALVDPLALDADELAPLFEVFEDPGVTKVLHAARNDINELDRDYGVGIANLFDTRTAARFLDYDNNGLDWLLEHVLGIDDIASMSRYDWSTRPLSEDARHYAARDVRHLLELRDRFDRQLRSEGWDRPFCQRCRYVADSVRFQANDFDPDGWRELNGIDGLDGRGRAAARALYRWRHRLCSRVNQSAVTIFPDGALMRLASRRPRTREQLRDLDRLPDELVADHADELLEILDEARHADAPPAEAPDNGNDSRSPGHTHQQRYDALRSWRNDTADRLGIPSEFIATNATFTKIADAPPKNRAELADFDEILDWHVEIFADEILELLEDAGQ